MDTRPRHAVELGEAVAETTVDEELAAAGAMDPAAVQLAPAMAARMMPKQRSPTPTDLKAEPLATRSARLAMTRSWASSRALISITFSLSLARWPRTWPVNPMSLPTSFAESSSTSVDTVKGAWSYTSGPGAVAASSTPSRTTASSLMAAPPARVRLLP